MVFIAFVSLLQSGSVVFLLVVFTGHVVLVWCCFFLFLTTVVLVESLVEELKGVMITGVWLVEGVITGELLVEGVLITGELLERVVITGELLVEGSVEKLADSVAQFFSLTRYIWVL